MVFSHGAAEGSREPARVSRSARASVPWLASRLCGAVEVIDVCVAEREARREPRRSIRATVRGAQFYQRLHWEAGLAGLGLYLESEASGVRGTGIGCSFDGLTHGLVGLRGGDKRQRIDHFAVGGPADDCRMQQEPPNEARSTARGFPGTA